MTIDADVRGMEGYLRRLRWALRSLPEKDADEIVAETRSHVRDRMARGAPLAGVLADFGAPEDYARGFIDEMELAHALASGRSPALYGAAARRAPRSPRAALATGLNVLLFLQAAMLAIVAVGKLVTPEQAGLWIGPDTFVFGVVDTPTDATERLGYGIFPLAAVSALVAWYGSRLVSYWALRGARRAQAIVAA